MKTKSIVLVGGGLAGLAAGCYGQLNGYSTTVLEEQAVPGGCCAFWKRKGYTFDGCLQYLAGTRPGGLFHNLWQELGALQGLDIFDFDTFNVVHSAAGDRTLRMFADPERLEEELCRLSPCDAPLVRKVVASVRTLLRTMPSLDQPDELLRLRDKLRVVATALPFLWTLRKWQGLSLLELSDRFEDPLLRRAFGVLEFPNLPAFQFLLALSLVGGRNAGLPRGGAPAFVQNIVKRYQDLGGTLRCKSPVSRILVQNDQAVGVRLRDGTELPADWVISACDGRRTVYDFLDGKYVDAKTSARFASWKRYRSGLRISLGVKLDLREAPATQTFCLHKPLQFGEEKRDFLVMRHFSYDPSFAPPGSSAVVVFTTSPVEPWRDLLKRSPEAYQEAKDRVAREVIAALGERITGLASNVEVVDVATPLTFERYTGNWDGSIEGWQPVVGGPGILTTISPRLPGLRRFLMAGHWTFVGGGTAPAANSGRAAIQILCNEDRVPFRSGTPLGC